MTIFRTILQSSKTSKTSQTELPTQKLVTCYECVCVWYENCYQKALKLFIFSHTQMFLFITLLLCPSYQVGHMSFIISMATVSLLDSFAISNPSDLQRASASFVPVRQPSQRDKIITDNLNSAPVLRRERRRRLLFYSFLFHTLSVLPTTSLFLSSFALPALKAERLNV